jgi:hypothetical protein
MQMSDKRNDWPLQRKTELATGKGHIRPRYWSHRIADDLRTDA